MNIRELRELSGMTQQAFGDYFGIPLRTIQNWEGGQRKCPDYLLDLIEYKLKKENIINTNQKKETFADERAKRAYEDFRKRQEETRKLEKEYEELKAKCIK